jgi:hypothetical protein
MAASATHEGGCMCGKVRFEAEGAPARVGICHCETCRRNSGSYFLGYAVFPDDRFRVTAGETAVFQSSERGARHFCPSCGSPLFSTWIESDHVDVDVYAGAFDSPAAFAPGYELWTVHRPSWLPDLGLSCYERDRPDGAPVTPPLTLTSR